MLFVINTLTLNGGTTFLIRFCRQSLKEGKRITVIVLFKIFDDELYSDLSKVADVYFLNDLLLFPFNKVSWSRLSILIPVSKQKIKNILDSCDYKVHVMGAVALIFALRTLLVRGARISLSVGVYHQYEYIFKDSFFFSRVIKSLLSCNKNINFIFFNDANKAFYSKFFSRDLSSASVVPIGIEVPANSSSELIKPLSPKRIVSIGNLYPFKTYNTHVISILPDLIVTQPELVYEIYGSGQEELKLKRLVKNLNLEKHVIFKGTIAYDKIDEVLHGSYAFIGSGTSIVEAAVRGIPSIIGIESIEEPITYGYLFDVPNFSYNEKDLGYKTVCLSAALNHLADEENWFKVAKRCREKALKFDIANTVRLIDSVHGTDKALDYYQSRKFKGFYNLAFLSAFIHIAIERLFDRGTFTSRRN